MKKAMTGMMCDHNVDLAIECLVCKVKRQDAKRRAPKIPVEVNAKTLDEWMRTAHDNTSFQLHRFKTTSGETITIHDHRRNEIYFLDCPRDP